MITRFKAAVALAGALSAAAALGALGQANAVAEGGSQYQPKVGQAGKDVVWVPTPDALVERMLTMAKVTSDDSVIDLGSGDGRLVIAAVQKFGATALGIEYNEELVELSQKAAQEAGVTGRARFVKADIFETDFSKATVITMYLLPRLNMKLRPKLLDMAPGTRLVSHAFTMEDWQAEQTATVEGRTAYLWIVPAKVQGNWTLTVRDGSADEKWQIALQQSFQDLSGSATLGDTSFQLIDARMRGAEIAFAVVDGNGVKRQFTGRAAGDKMEGSTMTRAGAKVNWMAVRGGR